MKSSAGANGASAINYDMRGESSANTPIKEKNRAVSHQTDRINNRRRQPNNAGNGAGHRGAKRVVGGTQGVLDAVEKTPEP